MTVEEIFYNKIIKDRNKKGCPYFLETRNYICNNKVVTERYVTFLTAYYDMNGINDDIRLPITEEEYEFLFERMKLIKF